MLDAVGLFGPVSFLSSARSFLTHRHLLGRGVSRLSRLACFALCVPCITRPAGVVGHLRSSCVGMWGRFYLLRLCCVPLSSLSRSSCRAAVRFASLCHSPRLATRRAGRCLVGCRSRVGSSPVPLLAVRGAGRRVRMACYHHGSFSPWCVRACCVDYVAGAVACRSYGIFVSSIDCTYRSIGFLIWPICPLLLLSASSYRLSITLS